MIQKPLQENPVDTESESTLSPKKKVKALMRLAFPPTRDPKSKPYIKGVRSILMMRICGDLASTILRYSIGTSKSDAWLAGREEGKLIVRRLKKEVPST